MTHSDGESPFEAEISEFAEQRQRRLIALAFQHPLRSRRWRGGLVLLLLLAVVAGVIISIRGQSSPLHQIVRATPIPSPTASPTPVSPAVFAALAARPLQLPAATSLAACPASRGRQISPEFGLAAGTGPLYIVMVAADGTATYSSPTMWGDHIGWGGVPQTLWIFPGSFAGPVLVRGERLDAVGSVRFNTSFDESLQSALQIVVQAQPEASYEAVGGWYIRFNAPGCYGLQVDWTQGTEQIVFRAQQEQGA